LALGSIPAAATRAQDLGDDPLGDIVLDMQLVVGDLTKMSTGKPTQETQKAIVDKVDLLIAELEKECEGCKSGAMSNNPSKPLQDSIIRKGKGGMGELHAGRQKGKLWGELPPKERDRILQSRNQGFPANYDRILEGYYKRIAEEKGATEAAEDDAEPKLPNEEDAEEPTSEKPTGAN
jgi:hypothetical protein